VKKDKKVWYWILFLIFFEALLFSYCYQFNPEYFMFESILLVLGIGAVCFLSELLITWMIILSFALSIFILVSGVVYISLQDTLVLIFSFPLLLGILSKIKSIFYKYISSVQIEERKARKSYQAVLKEIKLNENKFINALLIHYSHEEQFFELDPREYNHLITSIYLKISKQLNRFEKIFYVADGSFLILSKNDSRNLNDFYKNSLERQLKGITFDWGNNHQSIQFQTGFLEINKNNLKKFDDYSELISNLNRQLETDIIVEY